MFRILSVLAVCGLIAAPITRSAAAMMAMPATPSVATIDIVAIDAMAEDMPCCPKKAPRGCEDCPMMSLCQAGMIISLISGTSLIVFSHSARLMPMVNEANLSGQGQGPPHRPPKA